MAMSIYVQGIPDKETITSWSIDCVSWPRPLLEKDPRFRLVDLNFAYQDYVAVFTVKEAMEMNQKYLEDLGTTNKRLQQLLEATKASHSLVLVRMYEWESGLGD